MRCMPTKFHFSDEKPIVVRFEASSDGKTWVEIPEPVAELRAPEERS